MQQEITYAVITVVHIALLLLYNYKIAPISPVVIPLAFAIISYVTTKLAIRHICAAEHGIRLHSDILNTLGIIEVSTLISSVILLGLVAFEVLVGKEINPFMISTAVAYTFNVHVGLLIYIGFLLSQT